MCNGSARLLMDINIRFDYIIIIGKMMNDLILT